MKLENIQKEISEITKHEKNVHISSNNNNSHPETYIFISYDLYNSTAFKLREPTWPDIFSCFLECCRKYATKEFDSDVWNIRVWKYMGDEVIFCLQYPNFEKIADIPKNCFTILTQLIEYYEDLCKNLENTLSVKCTIWAVSAKPYRNFCNDNSKEERIVTNIVTWQDIEETTFCDFFGPDVDTGFRISKFSAPGIIILDANMAYLLLETKEADHAKIVAYENLKGVWKERRYPIIWYYPDWDNIENEFYYDDRFDSEIKKNIITNKSKGLDSLDKINEILKDVKLYEKAKKLQDDFKKYSNRQISNALVNSDKRAELHLVAVCVNEKNQILIFKRANEGKDSDGFWDFGCGHLYGKTCIKESLLESYEKSCGCTFKNINDDLLPFDYSITSKSKAAQQIRDGRAEVRMKETYPYGKKSRVSKKGVPYLIIPFRWGTPNDEGGSRANWKNCIPQTIHQKLKTLKIQKSLKTGITHLTPNARGEQVKRDEYIWKDRILIDGDQGNMSGMVRMKDDASKSGSTYFTFRIISPNSKSPWIRKKVDPIDVPAALAKESRAEVEKIIEKGILSDLNLG